MQFLEFSEAENQDDFHSTQAGCVHTQDQFGLYVMYDSALQDLEELESELLLIASHYIEKEKSKEVDKRKRKIIWPGLGMKLKSRVLGCCGQALVEFQY